MNKQLIASISIFTILIAASILFTIPQFKGALGLGNVTYFNVSLTISNAAPTISYVNQSSDSPSEATTKIIQISFNATDANGVADIPASSASVQINKSGVTRSSTSCVVFSSSSTVNQYICNITINYYDLPGSWTINATIFDGASSYAYNTTQIFTMGTTYAVALKTNSLTFSGTPGQNDISASNNPQYVNNTGNSAFNNITVKAFDLVSGSNRIGAGNFTANTSNNAVGHLMINNSNVALLASNLSVQQIQNIYIFADVPTTAQNGTFLSEQSWVVTVG